MIRLALAALACMALAGCSEKPMPPPPPLDASSPPCGEMAPWGFPDLPAGQAGRSRRVMPLGFVCRSNHYAIGYDRVLRGPRWVLEVVDRQNMEGPDQKVRKDWRADPKTTQAVSTEDYTPAITKNIIGVQSMASHKNVSANERMIGRTFYLSNTWPSYRKDDLPGAWNHLEDQVARWGKEKGKLLVISGGLFVDGKPLGWTGQKSQRNRDSAGTIAIPTHFYKVVFDPNRLSGIAFVVPNNDPDASDLPKMAMKIADVEKIAGITFFPGMEEAQAQKITSTVAPQEWVIR